MKFDFSEIVEETEEFGESQNKPNVLLVRLYEKKLPKSYQVQPRILLWWSKLKLIRARSDIGLWIGNWKAKREFSPSLASLICQQKDCWLRFSIR